jgi:hypothetical protein
MEVTQGHGSLTIIAVRVTVTDSAELGAGCSKLVITVLSPSLELPGVGKTFVYCFVPR